MLANRVAEKEALRRGMRQAEPRIFHYQFVAEPLSVRSALRAAMARFLRQMTEQEAGMLELILAEVLNNIVEHGYENNGDGSITLSIVRDQRGISCAVSDDGVALPMGCLMQGAGAEIDHSRPEPEDLPEGGFGWFLVRDLAEGLGYHRENGRNLLAFRLPLAPA